MYSLKTSSVLEAAMVPLMMLTERSESETDSIRTFAHHAGVVYQLRDDILDATADPERLGKPTDADLQKQNIVRSFGMTRAVERLEYHKTAALQACTNLSFDTKLLQRTVEYFADRKR